MTAPQPTYPELMAAFRAMDAACDGVKSGTATQVEYREAWDRYETVARAYIAANRTKVAP